MAGKSLTLHTFLPYRLSVAASRVSDMIAQRYRSHHDLSIPEWRLIAVLAEHGGCSQQAICRITGMDKVTVSRAAIALEKRKLLVRSANPEDGRSQLAGLSRAGRQLYGSIAPLALGMEAKIFACLSVAERRMLMRLLDRVDARMDALEDD